MNNEIKNQDPHYRNFEESIIPQDVNLVNRFCPRPFEHIEIMHGGGENQNLGFGDIFVCCRGWLNKKIGNYLEEDLKTIWNSTAAVDIRKSILNGSFEYCNKQACPIIQSGRLSYRDKVGKKYKAIIEANQTILNDLPTNYFLCYDRSCNLACKSCRNNLIHFKDGIGLENPMLINQKIMKDVFSTPSDRIINLKITGSGDPFASPAFKDLLDNLDGTNFKGLEIELYTNGLLLNSFHWQRLSHLHKYIKVVSVSIDAATDETYRKVRGGNWKQLISNLEFISQLKQSKQLGHFATNYVVQTKNYFEAAEFVRLCNRFNVDQINFSFIADWSTWSKEEFQEQSIWKKSHPLFHHLVDILQDGAFESKNVILGPLQAYRDQGYQVIEI